MMKIAIVSTLLMIVSGTVHFKEDFSDAAWRDRWVDSKWKGEQMGTWEWSSGAFPGDEKADMGIRTKDMARFYAISSKLEKPFTNEDEGLVVQFSVKNELRESNFCGGGYIKLMGADIDQTTFGGDTPYQIMFGPDMCGYDVSRIHVIFNYNGVNMLKKAEIKLEASEKDAYTHLYTLHIRKNNTYAVYMDMKLKASGNLADDWDFPPVTIDDPTDSKPSDWVDVTMIPDPEHVKPEGYDDIPEQIVDPEASQPDDWNEDDDGEWEAPMIPNPEYQGPWQQKQIPNPEYKGEWKAKQIPNPNFDDHMYRFKDIGSVGFELWTVENGSIFDNIFIGSCYQEAKEYAESTYLANIEAEKAAKAKLDKIKADAAAAAAAEEAGNEDVDEKEEL